MAQNFRQENLNNERFGIWTSRQSGKIPDDLSRAKRENFRGLGGQKIPASVANAFSVRIGGAGAGERARVRDAGERARRRPIQDATEPRHVCRGSVGWGLGLGIRYW